jgi:hypothetical protein
VLRRAYLATEIEVLVDGAWLPAADAVAEVGSGLLVLTAWNPLSTQLGLAENRRRNDELRAELVEQCDEVFDATGRSPDGTWHEESFATVGIGPRAARRIGRRYGQHAVFELRSYEQRVLGCADTWNMVRQYDEIVEAVPAHGDTLGELLREELGIDVRLSFARAQYQGWSLEGYAGAVCPNCGDGSLKLAGCDARSRDGVLYRALAFVCCAEPRVMLPHEVPPAYRALAKALRAYTAAAADADERGLTDGTYHAYVIELDDGVGPRDSAEPWVYVGQSSRTPEERFAQHLAGFRASRSVRKHGVCLRPDLTANQPPLRTAQESKAYERWLYEWFVVNGWPAKGGT